MKIKLILILFVLSFLFSITFVRAENEVCVYFFYGQGCPHCAQEIPFLQTLEEKYPELVVKEFEVYYNQVNQKLFEKISKAFNTISSGVPMTFIDGKAFVGFAEGDAIIYHPGYKAYIGYSGAIENAIKECIEIGGCDYPSEDVIIEEPSDTNQTGDSVPVTPITEQIITLPIGEISLGISLTLLGALLGFIDGALNPCALSVIFFLFAYLMSIGSRKKSLTLGLVYALTVFVVYFLFMYGILNVIMITGYLSLIKFIAGIVIIITGIIELKDFFWYGKGFSLEIPKFAKPSIERLIKVATIPSALLLGLLVSLVEIPCAGIFPFIYITVLGERVVSPAASLVYLLWYNIFFVVPLIAITLIFYTGLAKAEEAEKKRLKSRKYMRLIAGIIMITLGLWMLMS